jgi:DNA-binding response OmpR family regulator
MVYGVLRNFHGGLAFTDQAPGTAVKVYLPLTAPPAEGKGPAAARRRPAQKGRILVVDDDQLILDYLRVVLETRGFTVETVREPKAALTHFNGKGYDLLISDIVMPDMNGFDLVRRLRRQTPQLNVLFISGQKNEVDGDLRDYPLLAKPFDMDALVEAINVALKRENLQPVA